MRGAFSGKPTVRMHGKGGRKAKILKSEYLLLNVSERLRDYDKYETTWSHQREK